MFNFKTSGIAAGAAFILSFVIGLISGAGIAAVLLKAFIFAFLFFAISFFVLWLVAQFIPELLNLSEDEPGFPVPGSRVDINIGDDRIIGAFPSDNSDLLDDIAGRPSTPEKSPASLLDQGENAGYNEERDIGNDFGVQEDRAMASDFNEGTAKKTGPKELLPDMDGLTDGAPGSAFDGINIGAIGYESSGPRKPKSSSKKSEMAGDFDPKELAQAIQTVLKKDDKG